MAFINLEDFKTNVAHVRSQREEESLFEESKTRGHRCPMNHKCTQYFAAGRPTQSYGFLSGEFIACDTCDQRMDTKPSFYACMMCDYDICERCLTLLNRIVETSKPEVDFVDTDGDRIVMRERKEGRVEQLVNGKQSIRTVKKFELNTKTRKYTDDEGYGKIPKHVDIQKLKQDVIKLMAPKYPTAVHNPNWDFVQKTTMAQFLGRVLGEDCSFALAYTIASFVVERSITVNTLVYHSNSHYLNRQRQHAFPANTSVLTTAKANCSDGGILKECYVIPSVYLDEQRDLKNFFGNFKHKLEQVEEEALVGDVFCWDGMTLIATVQPKQRERHDRERFRAAMK